MGQRRRRRNRGGGVGSGLRWLWGGGKRRLMMMRSLGGERVMGKKLQTPFSSWLEVSVERERVCDLERDCVCVLGLWFEFGS